MKKIIIAVALIAVAAFVLINSNGHKATVTGEASPEPVVETTGTASVTPEAVQAQAATENGPIHLTSTNNANFAALPSFVRK